MSTLSMLFFFSGKRYIIFEKTSLKFTWFWTQCQMSTRIAVAHTHTFICQLFDISQKQPLHFLKGFWQNCKQLGLVNGFIFSREKCNSSTLLPEIWNILEIQKSKFCSKVQLFLWGKWISWSKCFNLSFISDFSRVWSSVISSWNWHVESFGVYPAE